MLLVEERAGRRSTLVTVFWFWLVKWDAKKGRGAVGFAKESGRSESIGQGQLTQGARLQKGV